LPISAKTVIVKAIMKDITLSYKYQTGIVPESVFYFFRILQSLVYLTFQWQLIINFKKENANSTIQTQIKNVFQWLKIFTWTSTLFLIALITLSLLAILDNAIFANG
jgi:ligand-binding SRPBCC domain-containing protein